MTDLKIYQNLTYIECYDWEIRTTTSDLKTIHDILKEEQFLNLWTELLNKSNIKRVFSKELSDVEKVIYSIDDKILRGKIKADIEKRNKEWMRVNVEIVKNLIAKYQ